MASMSPIRYSVGRSSARALPALCLLLGLCAAGEPVAKTEQDDTAWGEAVRSLQAGVRILPDENGKPHQGPYCFGDEVRLEFRLRNVGERMIKVEEFRPFPLWVLAQERLICCFRDGKDNRPVSTSVRVLWPTNEFVAALRTVVIGAPWNSFNILSASRTTLDMRAGRVRIALQHTARFMDKTNWSGTVTSGEVELEVTDDAEARKKGAIRLLERGVDFFQLSLVYYGRDKKNETPSLHLRVGEKSPLRNGNKTFLRITKDEAKAIIGYLGTTDFCPEALKEDRTKDIFDGSDAKEPHLVLSVTSEAHQGTDRESIWLITPTTAETAVKHIEALKPLLGKESSELLNQVIRDFQAPPGNEEEKGMR